MSESLPGQPSDPTFPPPAFRTAADVPFELSQEPVTPEGPQDAPPVHAPAYEHLGELPTSYGTQSVYLVAYDPKQLFAYWDVDWAGASTARYGLHVCRPDGQVEVQLEISAADAGRYIPVGIPGGTYYVEMGTHARDGAWLPTAHSARVTMPPDGPQRRAGAEVRHAAFSPELPTSAGADPERDGHRRESDRRPVAPPDRPPAAGGGVARQPGAPERRAVAHAGDFAGAAPGRGGRRQPGGRQRNARTCATATRRLPPGRSAARNVCPRERSAARSSSPAEQRARSAARPFLPVCWAGA